MELTELYKLSHNKITKKRTCLICNIKLSARLFGYHLDIHNISQEEYVIKYGYTNIIPKCNLPDCNNKTTFDQLSTGYYKYCSQRCQALNTRRDPVDQKAKTLISSKHIRNLNISNQSPDCNGVIYIVQFNKNSNVIKLGISTEDKTRLDRFNNYASIVFVSNELPYLQAQIIENEILNLTEEFLYYEEDRNLLIPNGGGVGELRYLNSLPIIKELLIQKDLINEI